MPQTDTTRLYAMHPHLSRIDELWGQKACRDLLNHLMNDTRGGERVGFCQENATTLLRLLMEHDREFPEFDDSAKLDTWSERPN